MHELTDRQLQILRYIAEISETRGFPPTIREIGEAMNIRSTNGVNDHLRALERKNFLSRGEQQSRSLVPTKRARLLLGLGKRSHDSGIVEVRVLGTVAAGVPKLAVELPDENSLRIDSFLLGGAGREVFALRIDGSSMIEAGIENGDYIFLMKTPNVTPGDIVVAIIDGEATCKYYFPEGDRIRFQPANSSMEPVYVNRSDYRETMILGKVVGLYRKYQSKRV